jgi:hypothetical protein
LVLRRGMRDRSPEPDDGSSHDQWRCAPAASGVRFGGAQVAESCYTLMNRSFRVFTVKVAQRMIDPRGLYPGYGDRGGGYDGGGS